MAETVRSLFEYRDPHGDGEGVKAAPPTRGKKRRVNRSLAGKEHYYKYFTLVTLSGDRKEGGESKRPTLDASSYSTQPAPHNWEVHCGSQVRLVVIAIRDITKGEEITVDYSLTEWGENLEDEPLSLSTQQHRQQQQQQDYVTPSWSLSPSSSPISHSDASDSDVGDEDNSSPRGRALRRRKKRRGTPSKKKTPHRTPPRRCLPVSSSIAPHHNRPLSSSLSPGQSSPACSTSFNSLTSSKPEFKISGTGGNVTANIPREGPSSDSARQTCEHCGRHFRSLGRHLDKHHAHQPDVCSALVERYTQMPRLHAPGTNPDSVHNHIEHHSKFSQARGQSRSSDPVQSGVQDLSMSPPSLTSADQSHSSSGRNSTSQVLTPPHGQNAVPVSVLKRSPPPVAHSAFLSLSRQLQSAEAWRLLCHSSLALLILYNRRRECEVSKLTIAEYRARVTPQCPVPVPPGAPPALTPLEASLSPFERLVLPHLPRVGVQGKRGRVQPLILPPHCEPCLELLLQTRHDVGVDPVNPYIFARPYHSPATPLRGTDLLRSLARSSGTRNPRALTQTRVRRQVAILTQLLLLGEGEEHGQLGGGAVERLEHFLEREYHVTQNCAGIGQDPGLMGRVGRVVLCGERDGVLFRGMSLNHICLELDGKRGVLKRPWSEAERAAVEEHLTKNINELRVPAKADCERCLQQCPLLVNNHRDWRAVKFYCHNRIQLLKKNQRRESQPQTLAVC
ncbi:hypothetical protein GOODEAATRI_001956 [Goodea atripinnis]|uniref:SET domain-containing protein n=1 Tax=Goodea atripinnis TaxID=208336 RepID=A0ABV0N864_9TELE